MMQVELQEAAKRGWKFLEVRLDFLAKAVDYKRLAPMKGCAWMATIRRPADGGRWPATEAERQMVLRQAVVAGCFDWDDLETDVADTIRRFGNVKRVISYHNLTETPPNLNEIYEAMLKQDGDVFKIAVLPKTAADLGRILDIQKRAKRPTICFGMGDLGFATRFTSLKFNAPWIYGNFNKERELAPGLPSVSDFRTTYPIRGIDADTKFFGVLGDPVAQSYSPILHNHTFLRNKQNAIYLPLRVPEGQLAEALGAYAEVPFSGYSVTIPHKQAAAKIATEADPLVAGLSAANTLINKPKGYYAANTDYAAALGAIQEGFQAHAAATKTSAMELGAMPCLVLGAGGAARAVAFALHRAGAQVTISSRTSEKAQALATEIGCKSCEWAARHNVAPCRLAVNCTPIGMFPKMDESPLHVSFLQPELFVFDTVYNPEQTLLLRDAKSRGAVAISGVEMFVRQAAEQFRLFTGIAPELAPLRELLRKAMSPLTKAMDEETAKSGLEEAGAD